MTQILTSYNPALTSVELGEQAALYALQNVLERMQRNLLIINRDINAKTIDVSNTTLFRVAADEYDDATLWTYIADVNGLTETNISLATLIIPPKPADNLRFGT